MPRNIEIKASIPNIEAVARQAAAIADQGPSELEQDDTVFPCESARLKLRASSTAARELIFYPRPNQPGPEESFYLVSPTSAPETLRQTLSLAYGQAGRVRSTAPSL